MVQVYKEWYGIQVYMEWYGIQVYKEWYGAGFEGMVWYRFRRNGMVQV